MIVVLSIYENAHGETKARLVENDDGKTAYYESVQKAKDDLNPKFPGTFLFIDIDAKEIMDEQ